MKKTFIIILTILAVLGLAFVYMKKKQSENKKQNQKSERTYETDYTDFSNVESPGNG